MEAKRWVVSSLVTRETGVPSPSYLSWLWGTGSRAESDCQILSLHRLSCLSWRYFLTCQVTYNYTSLARRFFSSQKGNNALGRLLHVYVQPGTDKAHQKVRSRGFDESRISGCPFVVGRNHLFLFDSILVPFVALSIPLFLLASSCILIFAGEMPVPLVSRHTLHCLRPVPASQRFFHPNLV